MESNWDTGKLNFSGMVVRIRLARGGGREREVHAGSALLVGTAALMQPAAVMAGDLAVWRFGADLQWTSEFAISSGLLSHWQVWLAIFLGLESAAIVLNRVGLRGRRVAAERKPMAAEGSASAPLAKSEL